MIKDIRAREIIDSRGNPTIQAEVSLDNGTIGMAAVPSGASTGSREALELRDQDPKRYSGKGVLIAVSNIHDQIKPALLGMDPCGQKEIDEKMIAVDATIDKSNLGANAMLAVSLANAHAAANLQKQPLFISLCPNSRKSLPVPQMNILNGGAHADNNVDLQEFMIIPSGIASFREALRCGVEIFHHLRKVLIKHNLSTAVGDEGGFAPDVKSNRAAFDLIMEAIDQSGYRPGEEVFLGMDAASSEIYKDGRYDLAAEGKSYSSDELIDLFAHWIDKYPIISIEDGLAENDWEGWRLMTERLGHRVQLTGDDLFVTNPGILSQGIQGNIANAILVKPNQIGTLTETIAAIELAQQSGYGTTISHRSGETEDSTIADLAVACAAGQIKTGSLCRSERIVKYNRLLWIEEYLGDEAVYPGNLAFKMH